MTIEQVITKTIDYYQTNDTLSVENAETVIEIVRHYQAIIYNLQLFNLPDITMNRKVFAMNNYNTLVRSFVQKYSYLNVHYDLVELYKK